MADRRMARADAEPPIRLVVIEPRTILGVGLQEILDGTPDFDVIAHVQTAAEAAPYVDGTTPDVVLVDVGPSESGTNEATRRLRQGAPNSAFVVMGGDDDDEGIVGAVGIGAVAHVRELAEPDELVATIRRAADGEDPLHDELIGRPDLVRRIVDGVRDTILAEPEQPNTLTTRELEVLGLVAAGSKNREISELLGLSEQTVKNHLSSVFHKLGVPNRTRAVMYASRQGWLDLADLPESPSVTAARD